jgi:hypothetical protein
MWAIIRTLIVACALTVAGSHVACAIGEAQLDAGGDAQATESARASAAVPKADVKKAISHIRHAWGSRAPCVGTERCAAYFESFGAALTFNDGTLVPLAHEQRLNRSAHDCILEARAALQRGERALAVQWVMAAHIEVPLTRNWLADHPDAVLEGLRHFGD